MRIWRALIRASDPLKARSQVGYLAEDQKCMWLDDAARAVPFPGTLLFELGYGVGYP